MSCWCNGTLLPPAMYRATGDEAARQPHHIIYCNHLFLGSATQTTPTYYAHVRTHIFK